ncbi:hypothetical protein NBH19_00860 [Rhizobium sp. S95]|uniref:Uncharacterized protein n=1 Tax=Ciceribacter sichuanensis TaxID=2949647 RepID=A0AAJ1BZ82_9HYPH|nr:MULTISPECIES: hypothetical protein [unclassified Ciceribacter]MCM2394626.1 hypothetical protein [Ciceribacter sp. S95]MCO5958667.1 hypothetical protein [Ciceribacter sp. S101]
MADGNREEDKLNGRWEIFQDQPNHGWIEWHGGPPPFTDGEVDVRLRSGRLIFFRHPLWIGQRPGGQEKWAHLGDGLDFIAYRRHPREAFGHAPNEALPF